MFDEKDILEEQKPYEKPKLIVNPGCKGCGRACQYASPTTAEWAAGKQERFPCHSKRSEFSTIGVK